MSVTKIETEKLVLGTTTSVLFDMSEPDACFRHHGPEAYRAYMKERKDELLPVNEGFSFAKEFSKRTNHEVVLMSRNNPITAIRAIRTMIHHGMVPSAFCFTNGNDPVRYLSAYGIDLFMSGNSGDVERAVSRGFGACYIEHPRRIDPSSILFKSKNVTAIPNDHTLGSNVVVLNNHIPSTDLKEHHVFDFDGVIADLSSEIYFQENGLDLYRQFERANLTRPLQKGPFHNMILKLSQMSDTYKGSICTVRGGWAAFRCLYDLVEKGININGEFHATAGHDKGPILSILKESYSLPTIFYDDRSKYVQQAKNAGLFAGQVIHPEPPKNTA